ncbi:hypothetical protein GCM10023231_10410 [Olivibacter ginsenosidimutans]|uniref:Gliding motility-associated C-terminal domain-containing protein n=1 Tax=Olivibacter ginsenosidimutans TaxID=1176537 RepID=A0ABP9ARD5_9SPHI
MVDLKTQDAILVPASQRSSLSTNVAASSGYNFQWNGSFNGGVFFNETYYNDDNDRRLIIKLIHDLYPSDAYNKSSSIYSLYVNQESKKIFGWGANKTAFDVKIKYDVFEENVPPLQPGYTLLGGSELDWQKGSTKGPYTFTLINVFGRNPKRFASSFRIWSQGVPNNPTTI